jgi:hypothetical protein
MQILSTEPAVTIINQWRIEHDGIDYLYTEWVDKESGHILDNKLEEIQGNEIDCDLEEELKDLACVELDKYR